MKTVYQILICLVATALFFALYSSGSGKNPFSAIVSENYNQSGVQEEISDDYFTNLTQDTKKSKGNFKQYKYRHTYILNVHGKVDKATFKVPIPKDENGKQYISNLKVNPKPDKLYSTEPNLIAEYNLKDLKTGKYLITVDSTAEIKRYDIAEAKHSNSNVEKENDLQRYLVPEKMIESTHHYIKQIASDIKGNNRDEIVNNIFQYVRNNIKYSRLTVGMPPSKALKNKEGKCGEFATAMVSLCRAKGIPARIVTGNIARSEDTKHTWVEVYFDEYGWVIYDPTIVDTLRTHYRNETFLKVERLYAPQENYISDIKNDLSPWYLTYSQINTGYTGDIKVTEDIQIREIK